MSKTGYKLMLLGALGGILAVAADAVIDYVFFFDEAHRSFWEIDSFEIYVRSVLFTIFVVYGVIAAKMIAKQERLDQELDRSRDNFRTLFDSLSHFLFVLDLRGHILEVNRAVLEQFGFEREALIGKEWAFLHSQGSESAPGQILPVADKMGPEEVVLVTRGGEKLCAEVRETQGDWGGQAARFLIGRDVTEKRQAERALEESEAKYSALVENSPMGVFIYQDGGIVFVNDTVTDIFGYSREEMIGREPWEVLHPEDRAALKERAARRLAGEIVPSNYETRGFTKSGEAIWVNARNTRIMHRGRPAIMGNVVDVTERKQTEETLRASERQRRQLSARILSAQEHERGRMARELHDSIGQTLSAIKFFVGNALKEVEKKGDTPGVVALREVVPRLQHAISEIRSISMDLRPSTLDDFGLLPTIGWIHREFESAHPEIRVSTDVEATEVGIPDELKIVVYRVVQEALNNVAKHSGAKSARIKLLQSESLLNLVVEDDGCGFDVGEALASITREGGFGLRSMQERVELSGGRCTIVSGNGEGTSIRATWGIGTPLSAKA